MKTKITSLKQALELTGLTQEMAGTYAGLSKAAVNRIVNGSYPNAELMERRILCAMVKSGVFDTLESVDVSGYETAPLEPGSSFKVNPLVFINTVNVMAINSLGDGLLDEGSTLNSSIGVAIGSAGYGKTSAVKNFAVNNDNVAYVLYIEGYTIPMLLKAITRELTGMCGRSYEQNLEIIKEATSVTRKLVVVDEADRMPVRFLEALRGLNEIACIPLLLVGEEGLAAKMAMHPRLQSRIRKPQVIFRPLTVTDVATYYEQAVGISIKEDISVCTILLKHAGRDFRTMINDANMICSAMNTNGVTVITKEFLNEIYRNRRA